MLGAFIWIMVILLFAALAMWVVRKFQAELDSIHPVIRKILEVIIVVVAVVYLIYAMVGLISMVGPPFPYPRFQR